MGPGLPGIGSLPPLMVPTSGVHFSPQAPLTPPSVSGQLNPNHPRQGSTTHTASVGLWAGVVCQGSGLGELSFESLLLAGELLRVGGVDNGSRTPSLEWSSICWKLPPGSLPIGPSRVTSGRRRGGQEPADRAAHPSLTPALSLSLFLLFPSPHPIVTNPARNACPPSVSDYRHGGKGTRLSWALTPHSGPLSS